MLQRVLIGAAAGAIATVPQSAVVWGMKLAGVYQRTPPPERVAHEVTDAVVGEENVPQEWWTPVVLAQHFGFGASVGALFGATTALIRPTMAAGLLAGLAVWKASYDGWIPALRIMPPPEEDEAGRQTTMFLAHVAYGIALGYVVDRLTAREGAGG
jgi:hypothetical protein